MTSNNDQNGTNIAQWGSRNDVREIVQRINAMRMSLPGGNKLDDVAIRTLAQASVAHGLNPLNGEIWIIPGSGLMVGIKGLRKHAKRQLHADGKSGNMWTEFVEITDPDTLKRWRITGDALVFECRLYDTESIELYVKTIEHFKDLGMPWETTVELVGSRPYTTGIGVLKANEKTKMEPIQCARKRAEADAIKRRFDVEFGPGIQDADEEPDAYSGDWTVEGETVEDSEAAAERVAESASDRAALFGTKGSAAPPQSPRPPRPVDETGVAGTGQNGSGPVTDEAAEEYVKLKERADSLGIVAPLEHADEAKDIGELRTAYKALQSFVDAAYEEIDG